MQHVSQIIRSYHERKPLCVLSSNKKRDEETEKCRQESVEQQLGSSRILEVLRAESRDSHELVKPTACEELSKASSEISIATKPSNTKCFLHPQLRAIVIQNDSFLLYWPLNSMSFLQTLRITFSRFQAFRRSVFQVTVLSLESLDYLRVTCNSL